MPSSCCSEACSKPFERGTVTVGHGDVNLLRAFLVGLIDGRKPAGGILCLSLRPDLRGAFGIVSVGVDKIKPLGVDKAAFAFVGDLFGLCRVADVNGILFVTAVGSVELNFQRVVPVQIEEWFRFALLNNTHLVYPHCFGIERQAVGGIEVRSSRDPGFAVHRPLAEIEPDFQTCMYQPGLLFGCMPVKVASTRSIGLCHQRQPE